MDVHVAYTIDIKPTGLISMLTHAFTSQFRHANISTPQLQCHTLTVLSFAQARPKQCLHSSSNNYNSVRYG